MSENNEYLNLEYLILAVTATIIITRINSLLLPFQRDVMILILALLSLIVVANRSSSDE